MSKRENETFEGEEEVVEFDIDDEFAQEAQRREAKGKSRIPIRLEGKIFHFKPASEWDMKVVNALAEEDGLENLAYEILPENEAEEFLDLDYPQGKFSILMKRLNEACGVGQ